MKIKEQYTMQFESLFENQSTELEHYAKRGYWINEETTDNSILFIGINPSYPHKDYEYTGRVFYEKEPEKNPYFDQIRKLHKDITRDEINIDWTHLDLLILRETRQNEVKKIIKTESGKEFIKENLKISREIIEGSKPKIVVIINTLARDLLINKSINGYKTEWNEEIGTYVFSEGTKLDGTPIFISGMLSGQRALDIGSRERLAWHIRKTLQYIDGKLEK